MKKGGGGGLKMLYEIARTGKENLFLKITVRSSSSQSPGRQNIFILILNVTEILDKLK